jgi:hypothetical protein
VHDSAAEQWPICGRLSKFGHDFALVTRNANNSDSQRWIVIPSGNNAFTVQQKSSGRFMDAHEIEEKDFALVTRPAQNNDTQRWLIKPV